MTGAGAATVAFGKETEFLGSLEDADSDGTPEYYLPGRNVTVQDASLQNQLQRMREPHTAEAVDSLAGALDGAVAVEYAMSADTHGHVRDLVFNDAGTGFTTGHAQTSRWYLGVEYLESTTATATAERVLKGVIPLRYVITYNRDSNTVRETLTLGYANEDKNTAVTPGTITGPTDGNDVPFHGVTLDIDATTVQKLQSATLTFDGPLARFHTGPSRTPIDAVAGAPQVSLETEAIFGSQGTSHLELAYGSTGATTTQDQLSNVAGSLAFDVAGATVATYTLPKLKPDRYEWSDLVSEGSDLTEPINWHVNGEVSIA